ncbi:MAG: hypothetical protein K2O10_05260, partial [Muribaculaceae bacterium]|nr:hypothetical protein [Muribaculaceae bacterium]
MTADSFIAPGRDAVESLKTELKAGCTPAGAEVIYSGRNRLYRLEMPGGATVCVKDFRPAGLIKGVLYGFFRKSKAQRSHENAQMLLRLGFDTPEPVGWCVTR